MVGAGGADDGADVGAGEGVGEPDDGAAHGELTVWKGVAGGRYRLGHHEFTTEERDRIDARIRQLHDAGFE